MIGEGVRLHVVSGKGGTGKTTVAGALAIALAADGRRVLVAEVEGRQGLARLFDVPPLTYEERRIATAGRRGEVYGVAVDPEPALVEYLAMFYKAGVAGGVLKRMGLVEFATTIAPGVRDVLLTGKVKEIADRKRRDGRPAYDAVVLDAPPTGRVRQFLDVTNQLSGLTRTGPIRRHADSVARLLRSPATQVHLVTLLEDMPVQETLDAAAELREAGLRPGLLVVNSEHAAALETVPDAERIAEALRSSGVRTRAATAGALAVVAEEHVQRTARETGHRERLASLGLPTVGLPWLPDAADVGGVHELAGLLREQLSDGGAA